MALRRPACSDTIVFIEPLCEGREHATFNAGLLLAATRIGRIVFLAERSHMDAVSESMPADTASSVQWQEISIPPRHVHGFRHRLPSEWAVVSRVWRVANQER